MNNYFAPNAKHLSPIFSRWLDKYFGANVLSQTNRSICLWRKGLQLWGGSAVATAEVDAHNDSSSFHIIRLRLSTSNVSEAAKPNDSLSFRAQAWESSVAKCGCRLDSYVATMFLLGMTYGIFKYSATQTKFGYHRANCTILSRRDIIALGDIINTSAPNRCITRKRHPNGNPNLLFVNELTVGCLCQS